MYETNDIKSLLVDIPDVSVPSKKNQMNTSAKLKESLKFSTVEDLYFLPKIEPI